MSPDSQPVRYAGGKTANTDYHDGQLRPVVGVQSHQVLRANRSHPEWSEDTGWTYNHAPMLAYWRDRFYLEYLSTPANEHEPPGHTLLTTSTDGIHWRKPEVVFPRIKVPEGVYQGPPEHPLPPGSEAVMHQRMGFYVSPQGRLLALGFYGICPVPQVWPNDGRGMGRVVREIYEDGSFGPVYFLRYNRHAGWNETNTSFPFYLESEDGGFVGACAALLEDKLQTLQWWEEDRSEDGFYTAPGYKALSYYHIPDGRVVGVWKWSKAAISADEGRSWTPVADVPSLIMAGGKIWGQRTSDGRFALVYNPNPEGNHRWPLAVVTGDDGVTFDNMLLVEGESPPRRYEGYLKDYGMNYVRGITEGNGTPPDGDMWLTYSMNKEDIWVTRVPVPIRFAVEGPVHDNFNELEVDGPVTDWNIYSSKWASVSVVAFPSESDRSLRLQDSDPCDYARALRVFAEGKDVSVRFRVRAEQNDHGQLYIEICDHKGAIPVWLLFDADGMIKVKNSGHLGVAQNYEAGRWYDVRCDIDAVALRYRLSIDGKTVVEQGICAAPVLSVERIVFRTGPRRTEPTIDTPRHGAGDIPGADEQSAPATFYVNSLDVE